MNSANDNKNGSSKDAYVPSAGEIEYDMPEVIQTSPPTGSPREDMIGTATTFLLSPKVQVRPQSEQRAFLLSKGLSPVEIDMAFQRQMSVLQSSVPMGIHPSALRRTENTSWADFFNRLAMTVAVFGSASYAVYWAYKTYIEPRMAASRTEYLMEELLSEMRLMREDRKKEDDQSRIDRQAQADHMVQTAKSITDLRDELNALKKMFVARNQFAAMPQTAGVPVKIPSWQQNFQTDTPGEVKTIEKQVDEQENTHQNGPEPSQNENAVKIIIEDPTGQYSKKKNRQVKETN